MVVGLGAPDPDPEGLVVVDPLTSWFTTVTATPEEFLQVSPDCTVALLLNMISAHYFRCQYLIHDEKLQAIALQTHVVQSTSSLAKGHNLKTRILSFSRSKPRWKSQLWQAERSVSGLV